jgi:hypothetical protein
MRRFTTAIFAVTLTTVTGGHVARHLSAAPAQGDRDRFIGAWRLAWLEEPGPDGRVQRADSTGLFVFTRDGGGTG